MDELRSHGITATLDQHIKNHLDELFFKKLVDWDNEVEYRFVVVTGEADPIFVDVRRALRAVILGALVDPVYVPSLAALCDPLGVEIHQLRWTDGRPWLATRADQAQPGVVCFDLVMPLVPPPLRFRTQKLPN